MDRRTDTLTIYSTSWCGDCQVAKKVLEKLSIPFQEVNIEHDPEAADYVMRVNGGKRSVPTVVYGKDAASFSRFNRAKFEAFLEKHALLAARV